MTSALTVFSAPGTWIESAAIDQLNAVASLPGMRRAVGLPDLHPGKGAPIGAAFAVEGLLYPHLVGNDIGCGMGLWTTDQPAHRFKLDRVASRVNLDGVYDGDIQAELAAEGVDGGAFAGSLGTIGGGKAAARPAPAQADSEVASGRDATALRRVGRIGRTDVCHPYPHRFRAAHPAPLLP